jgi:hypothetical protein
MPYRNEAKSLAAQLGITARQIRKMGLVEAKRLLTMDESSQRLVMSFSRKRRIQPAQSEPLDRLEKMA